MPQCCSKIMKIKNACAYEKLWVGENNGNAVIVALDVT